MLSYSFRAWTLQVFFSAAEEGFLDKWTTLARLEEGILSVGGGGEEMDGDID